MHAFVGEQALPGRQSVWLSQPHVPPTHCAPPPAAVHPVHTPAPVPQVAAVSPLWHVPVVRSQQPPLHWPAPVHAVVHLWLLQAVFAGQSVATLQPQLPATQAVPFELPVQSVHAEAEPQAVGPPPSMHMPLEPPQQNPAPQPPPSHDAVQEPPMHVGVSPPHVAHLLPDEPHAAFVFPGTQVVPLQQPPVQGRTPPSADAQLVVQSPVLGLQAWPVGQLPGVQGTCVSRPPSPASPDPSMPRVSAVVSTPVSPGTSSVASDVASA